jgi:hypothetical protein
MGALTLESVLTAWSRRNVSYTRSVKKSIKKTVCAGRSSFSVYFIARSVEGVEVRSSLWWSKCR